ncbi:MAG TPA: Lrp/AsnC family transcriptional regulator [Mycobacteriales bacterium]|nr:Lrp/AsnC family transcriptional regulator [Mycobacteriales bacterium]
MGNLSVLESSSLDPLSHRIIHALQIDGRASFNRIAAVLDVSEQTVARRYRRMRADGIIRVVGLLDPARLGHAVSTVRIQCRPGGAAKLADALARRADVAWVSLTSGGTEIVCSVRSISVERRDELLLQRLPSTSAVLGVSAHTMLHRFLGMRGDDWVGHGSLLTHNQIRRLGAPSVSGEPVELADEDRLLLDALARDGRAGYATLARATSWNETKVARRLAALRASGAVFFDVDLAVQRLGFHTMAHLWLAAAPRDLAAAGEAIARHPESGGVSAVTGTANLWVSVVCRDADDLYRYITERIGEIPGIRRLEISPVLRQVKQAGSILSGGRLADPTLSRS